MQKDYDDGVGAAKFLLEKNIPDSQTVRKGLEEFLQTFLIEKDYFQEPGLPSS